MFIRGGETVCHISGPSQPTVPWQIQISLWTFSRSSIPVIYRFWLLPFGHLLCGFNYDLHFSFYRSFCHFLVCSLLTNYCRLSSNYRHLFFLSFIIYRAIHFRLLITSLHCNLRLIVCITFFRPLTSRPYQLLLRWLRPIHTELPSVLPPLVFFLGFLIILLHYLPLQHLITTFYSHYILLYNSFWYRL